MKTIPNFRGLIFSRRLEWKSLALLLCLTGSAAAQTLIGWNNLGMHCMADDYSVFSILPPYHTVNCQLLDAHGHLVTNPAGLVATYEAVADPDASASHPKRFFRIHANR